MGGSNLKGNLEDDNNDKDVHGDEEDDGKDVVGNVEFLAGMDEDDNSNDRGEGGGCRERLVMARDLFSQKERGNNSTAGDASACMSMQHSASGEKRLSTQSSQGGKEKKAARDSHSHCGSLGGCQLWTKVTKVMGVMGTLLGI
jgi:hypothetical protein